MQPGEVRYADGSSREFDHLIAFPPYVAAVRYPGLASDERGFVETDKVGTSPVWRAGKKMLGFSVPMRFGAGQPFHAGKTWQAMDAGIKVMSRTLAD